MDYYTFTVKNTCDHDITYELGFVDKLTNNKISYDSIRMELDGVDSYASLYYDSSYAKDYGINNISKTMKYVNLGPNEEKEHNFKMWIDETSENEQGKSFKIMMFVRAGQEIENIATRVHSEGCFRITGDGVLDGYYVDGTDLNGNPCVWSEEQAEDFNDYDLEEWREGTRYVADVKIPETVDGIPVKSIVQGSFSPITVDDNLDVDYHVYSYWLDNDTAYYVIPDKDKNFVDNFLKISGAPSVDILAAALNIPIDMFDYFIDNMILTEYSGPYVGKSEETLSIYISNHYYNVAINSLDLSEATQLEIIGGDGFFTYFGENDSLVIPDRVKKIGAFAFFNYRGKDLTLNNRIKKIEKMTFPKYVGTNKDLTIPRYVKTIDSGAFASFNGRKLNLNKELVDIVNAFGSYVGQGQDLVIPKNVETIQDATFSKFNGNKIIFNNKLKHIGNKAFEEYHGENQEIILPDSVENIMLGAFSSFSGNNVVLGSGIKNIGYSVFGFYSGNININMTENQWNSAITSGELNLDSHWKNENAVLKWLD